MKTKVSEKIKIWIEALRSDKYIQGIGQLKVIDIDGNAKHCCIGILGETLPECTFDLTYNEDSKLNLISLKDYSTLRSFALNEEFYLNTRLTTLNGEEIKKWLANKKVKVIDKDSYEWETSDLYCYKLGDFLMSLNDVKRLSFEEIAEFIELFYLPYVIQQENLANE